MELRQYLDVIHRRRGPIVGAALALALSAYLLADLGPERYEATARVLLRPDDVAAQLYRGDAVEVLGDPDRHVAGQLDIIESAPVAALAAEALDDDDDPTELLAEVSVRQGGVTDVVEVTGRGPDPVRAAEVANAFARGYIENRRLHAVEGLEEAVAELGKKLAELEWMIAVHDAEIAASDVSTEAPAGADEVPTGGDASDAARSAAAAQYQSMFARQQELAVGMALERGNAELIAEADAPSDPVSPAPARDAILGGFIGLLLGLGVALLREQLDDRIRWREDVGRATGLPILADLPRSRVVVDGPPVVLSSPRSALAEAVRSLRTALRASGGGGPAHRIVVTSPSPGDGRSTVAANLAVAYAQAGQRTVLVSGDLRRPSIERCFGFDEHGRGLSELLAGPSTAPDAAAANGNRRPAAAGLEEALLPAGPQGLHLLPSGQPPPNPAELVGSARMAEVLDELGTLADVVVVDTPPLLSAADAAALASLADAVLLVASVGETRRGAVVRACEVLASVGVAHLALVLNKVDAGADGHPRDEVVTAATPPDRRSWSSRERAHDPVESGEGREVLAP